MRNKNACLRTAILWVLALGWMAVMFILSGQTAGQSRRLSGGLVQLVLRLFPQLPLSRPELSHILRKTAHFAVFAVEGFLLCLAVRSLLRSRGLAVLFSALCCGALAVLNEYHQTFADGRSCELRDMLINFSGALLGVAAALAVHAVYKCIQKRRRNVII